MTKLNQDKIVRAAIGSARLEGYKGSLKVSSAGTSSAPKAKAAPKPGAAGKR
jgi:hypothetical protein